MRTSFVTASEKPANMAIKPEPLWLAFSVPVPGGEAEQAWYDEGGGCFF